MNAAEVIYLEMLGHGMRAHTDTAMTGTEHQPEGKK